MAFEQEHFEFIRDELLKDRNYDEVATAFRRKYVDFPTHVSRNSIARLIRDGKIWEVSSLVEKIRIESYIANRSTNRTAKPSKARAGFLALRRFDTPERGE